MAKTVSKAVAIQRYLKANFTGASASLNPPPPTTSAMMRELRSSSTDEEWATFATVAIAALRARGEDVNLKE